MCSRTMNTKTNQGYNKNDRDNKARRPVEVLPSPELLEGYNYVVEGSAKMILTMFEREQAHRHDWESQALKSHVFSSILGQVLGFFIAVSIFISATIIGMYGDTQMASFIWVFGLAIVVMAATVWAYAKSIGQRPLFARPVMREHFRAQKEGPDGGQPKDEKGSPIERRT